MTEGTPPSFTPPPVDEVARLHARIDELEARTKLLSRNFWTRAFAAYGLVFVAGLCIAIPIYVLVFLVVLVSGGALP